eukprot:TRINITY_DN1913_c0_g1_i2.p1 TRINITY_DN1913_c0_g1~~TRINITY_DN1913_c0_g1_i2.p1  ORF type:complete len:370 (+),score=133.53 TRINITY_DN1913_c0_g1_i2:94-1203(+)
MNELFEWIEREDEESIKKSIEKDNAIINRKRDQDHLTPLMMACLCGKESIIQFLLQNGAKMEERTPNGNTALHWAATVGQSSIIGLLTECETSKIEIDVTNHNPLMFASMKGHLNFVEELLRRGANVNHKNKHEMTALFCASIQGHVEVLNLLIASNANVAIRNQKGQTAITLAKNQICKEILTKAWESQTKSLIPIPNEKKQKKRPDKKKSDKSNSNEETKKKTESPIGEKMVSISNENDLKLDIIPSASQQIDTKSETLEKKKEASSPYLHALVRNSVQKEEPFDNQLLRLHNQAKELDLKVGNVIGLDLENLSMSQLCALEEIHQYCISVIHEKKILEARKQERLLIEEESERWTEIIKLKKSVVG